MSATKRKGFLQAMLAKDALKPAKPNEIDKQMAGHISSITPPGPMKAFGPKRK